MSTKTDLAYTAGIIDGEGTIVISKTKSPGSRAGYEYRMSVSVLIRERELCEWLQLRFGGNIYKHAKPRQENHSQCWVWRLLGVHAAEFLKLIMPYLQLKRLQAENAIRYQGLRVQGRVKSLTSDELENRNTLYEVQKFLNHSRTRN